MVEMTELRQSQKCVTSVCPLQHLWLTFDSVAPVAKIRVDNLHYDLTEDDLDVGIVFQIVSTRN